MTEDQELRLEALRLAVKYRQEENFKSSTLVVEVAEKFERYLRGAQ